MDKSNKKILVIVIIVLVFGLIMFVFIDSNWKCRVFDNCISLVELDKYCKNDGDCSCGRDIKTKECFYGNKNFVENATCPDFCTGIDGNLEIKCIENKCEQIRK